MSGLRRLKPATGPLSSTGIEHSRRPRSDEADARGSGVRRGLALLFAVAPLLPLLAFGSERPAPQKIYTEEPGVYRVRFEELFGTTVTGRPIPSAGLGLTTSGRPVPIHVEDGGDGSFGPGDSFEFVAERLAGEFSQFNEYTSLNVYVLDPEAKAPARVVPVRSADGVAPHVPVSGPPYRVVRREEKDLILLRFSDFRRSELWYWAKLAYLDAEPFRVRLDLPGLDTASPLPVKLRACFRGISQPTSKIGDVRDHRVEVSLNGRTVIAAEWNGIAENRTFEVGVLGASTLAVGENRIELRVPARPQLNGDPLVDVSALNWIEVEYPRTALTLEGRQELVRRGATDGPGAEALETRDGQPIVVYGEKSGHRYAGSAPEKAGDLYRQSFSGLASEESFWVVPEGAQLSPVAVEPVRHAGLASPDRQADYILIVHPRLREALAPLVEFHRARGLSVAVVDVREIYDEFSHGILDPHAIRSFLAEAVRTWRRPAPRFVLLAGDASWDSRNRTLDEAVYPDTVYRPAFKSSFYFTKTTPYPENAKVNHRNLVPTWSYDTYDGHAAGDNWFAALGDPDGLPQLAIGRIPVTEPEEAAAVVEKTISYASRPQVGPWRRRAVWITNGTDAMRSFSDILSKELAPKGIGAFKVFPNASEKNNAVHQKRIRETFADGPLFVHFNGHGGRFIWLTAIHRVREDNDLFTLEDLDLLAPTTRYPIVLSMTCYSAPFDHPGADSIGEKLLRLHGKGAVAVIAASWRNAPTLMMSQSLFSELTLPTTVGEALMRAKRRAADQSFLEQYNLLGDPALPVGLPSLRLVLEAESDACGPVSVRGSIPAPRFDGRVLVEWYDGKGDVVESTDLAVRGTSFSVPLGGSEKAGRVRGVSVYAWDEAAGLDGMGGMEIPARPGPSHDVVRPER